MKRKMIGITSGYIFGLFFVSFFTHAWHLAIPAVVFLLYVIIGRMKNFSVNDFAVVAVAFAVAFCSGEIYTIYLYNNIIKYDNMQGDFSGIVQEYDAYDNDKARYIIKGKINNDITARISLYTNELDLRYGDRVNISGCTFRKITGDYLFDSETYYKADRVFLTAEKAQSIGTEKRNSHIIKNFLMDYRGKIISDFRVILGEECGGFLAGMVFGEKRYLESDVKNSMYRTGIGHIMAVSGLHISVMILFIISILDKLKINKFISFIIINIFIFIIITIANSPVSAVRASIMAEIAYSARFFRRKSDTFNSLAVAVLAISVSNPFVIYSQGFILSVAGTFGAGVFAPYMTKNIKHKTLRKILFMLCITVSVMPVSMIYFDEVSVVAPLANMLIVPMCSLCMILGMIYTFTGGLLNILLCISGGIIKIIIFISEKMAGGEYSCISCGNKITARLSIICVVAVAMIKISTENRKFISVAIIISGIFVFFGTELYMKSARDIFTVAVVGKNNNIAVVVSYHDSDYVVELSGYRNSKYVNKYLAENNINNIDYVVLHNNVQYLYALYRNNIKSKYMAYGNINPRNEDEVILFGDEGYTIEAPEYSIIYENNILRVIYNDMEIDFVSTKNTVPENKGLNIFYGNILKSTDIQYDDRSIYIDGKENLKRSGVNNFTMKISPDGNIKIHQLK